MGLLAPTPAPASDPADRNGRVVDAWYGSDADKRIPLQRVVHFLAPRPSRRAA